MNNIKEGTIVSLLESDLGNSYPGSQNKTRNCIVIKIYEAEYSDDDNEYFVVETTTKEQKEYGDSKNRIYLNSQSSFAMLEIKKIPARRIEYSYVFGELPFAEMNELVFEIENNNENY